MATSIAMPLLSPTMTEGTIAKWNKKEGDKVGSGDSLAEVETDKATLDVEAYDEGTLLKILAPAGAKVKVGAAIAVVGAPGEDISAIVSAAGAAGVPPPAPATAPPKPVAIAPMQAPVGARRVRSSPLARKMAREGGVDLARVAGSGPGGRVIKRDVEAAMGAGVPAVRPAVEQLIPLSAMRRVIAERMVQAKREVPHFYLTVEVDMEKVVALRAELKEAGVGASINDFIIRACALALTRVPEANRSYTPEGLVQHASADIGVAVALDEGLITPVVRSAEAKSVSAIAAEMKQLAERARNKKLRPEEYQGGSMALSNLGMYGIDEFIAVINPPHSCILAVGAATERPAVVGGQLAVRRRMTATLSGDHRAIDGAIGAKLLTEIRALLERPVLLGF